ncbi:hypothetical protein AMTR_s00095p00163170 [Amborella trichopoda]|uniref:Uncharacterized protein n=1 Tax=Amborella trichopoda TaxID=13333 RepID=W1NP68_AMBTC|nr:hypothetical protein AMTR_s00095p00163170 [Amborella trichopoda]
MANSTLTQLKVKFLKILLMESLSSQQVGRQAAKARQRQQRQYKEEQSIFLPAIAEEHDPPEPSPETRSSW